MKEEKQEERKKIPPGEKLKRGKQVPPFFIATVEY